MSKSLDMYVAASGVFHFFPPDFNELEPDLYWIWIRESVCVFTTDTNPDTIQKFANFKIRGLRIENVQMGLSSEELHRFIKQKYSGIRRVNPVHIGTKNINIIQARELVYAARSTKDCFEKRHERFTSALSDSGVGLNLGNIVVGNNNVINQHFAPTDPNKENNEKKIAAVEENVTQLRDALTKLVQADLLKRVVSLEQQVQALTQKLEDYEKREKEI